MSHRLVKVSVVSPFDQIKDTDGHDFFEARQFLEGTFSQKVGMTTRYLSRLTIARSSAFLLSSSGGSTVLYTNSVKRVKLHNVFGGPVLTAQHLGVVIVPALESLEKIDITIFVTAYRAI